MDILRFADTADTCSFSHVDNQTAMYTRGHHRLFERSPYYSPIRQMRRQFLVSWHQYIGVQGLPCIPRVSQSHHGIVMMLHDGDVRGIFQCHRIAVTAHHPLMT